MVNFWSALFSAAALYLSASSMVVAEDLTWLRSLSEAKQEADLQSKDLFLVFTGHGWCYSCGLLDRDVFQQSEFQEAIRPEFVLVEFDFTFGDSPSEKQRERRLRQQQADYLAPAVPTVVLADQDGLPYAVITGWEDDDSIEAYLAEISTAQKSRIERDQLLAKAASKSGNAKAQLLDQALQTIDSQLGSLEERKEDPLLYFYADIVKQLLDSLEAEHPLADRYRKRRQSRDAFVAFNEAYEKLKEFNAKKDYPGAIAYLEEAISNAGDQPIRWRLENSRQSYLEWSKEYSQGLKNCRRLLKDAKLPNDFRKKLAEREAYCLFRLGRIEEGVACYDRLIASAKSDTDKQSLMGSKAQMLFNRDPVEQSIDACQDYSAATRHGTEDWKTAMYLLSFELKRAGRHSESLSVLSQLLEVEKLPLPMLGAVESLLALDRQDEALKMIEAIEAVIKDWKESSRIGEQNDYRDMQEKLNRFRSEISTSEAAT